MKPPVNSHLNSGFNVHFSGLNLHFSESLASHGFSVVPNWVLKLVVATYLVNWKFSKFAQAFWIARFVVDMGGLCVDFDA